MLISAGLVVGSALKRERLMLTTSSREIREEVMKDQISKSSADRVTQGRHSKNTGLCLECGSMISCPPGRGRPPSLCESCRTRKCKECGNTFIRVYRSDKKKDAGVFCSRGCFFVNRKKKVAASEESSSHESSHDK